MSKERVLMFVLGGLSLCGLAASGIWFAYQNHLEQATVIPPASSSLAVEITASSTSQIDQEQLLEELRQKLPPVDAMPAPSASSTMEGTQTPESDITIDRPEFSKPEPPPAPSIPDDQKYNPDSKPTPPASSTPDGQKDNPGNKPGTTPPKNGDKRTNAEGQTEMYIEGFGWITDSGEPNQNIPAHNAGTGEVIGY